ncbi:glycoside hydrolase family 19 protein [Pseudomonas aeruginosa]|uniref:glycoside hydrolase family 19 protein n=1 Tax=Pseudomonas aeruginosa TaxID=287 RepID=UPI002077606D|nr:glycoside hydrolase family 19 protein [Pseudomonas aeruginosa]MCM8630608.1 glycoside hydrolase family 19 protein [Pseudomonas aeruginosa]MCM8686652.1 glycoside hydrolase family 19 protein [Pseudomonas aeruginosa]MCP2660284.1 glycoside hydrolase family 19 protein [Pseudomonas aeruginosa]HEK0030656.1 glycoside hydrolase family 19 protein [Pseudomonas aeruginosa]HEK0760615.1 glycoside hydrolase family 19 protein [Pseudomonas aeruginosa]
MMITADQLGRATGCGAATATIWLEHLNGAMARFEINTPERVAMFLAQVGHESQSLKRLVENLNYSAEGLLKTWPKRFAPVEARQYARQPERIANRVYANRMGNGSPDTGDGYRYRGRGLIMITGHDNYAEASRALALPLVAQPELLEQRTWAAIAAGWFWHSRGLNDLADQGRFEKITLRINGSFTGAEDRNARLEWARAALKGE